MKHRLIAVLAASLVVAACAAPGAATTVTVTAPAPSADLDAPSLSDDDEFLMLLRTEDAFLTVPDSTLTELGRQICRALDNGFTLSEIGEVALSSGLSTDEAASIVAAAVVAYCPQHRTEG